MFSSALLELNVAGSLSMSMYSIHNELLLSDPLYGVFAWAGLVSEARLSMLLPTKIISPRISMFPAFKRGEKEATSCALEAKKLPMKRIKNKRHCFWVGLVR